MTGRLSAVCAGVLLAVLAVPLGAHMKATRFEPATNSTVTASPKQVAVWFTQAPDEKLSHLEMSGPSGPLELTGFHVMTQDKAIMATVAQALPDGRYTVRWRSAGKDGHVQKGEFAFTVQQSR